MTCQRKVRYCTLFLPKAWLRAGSGETPRLAAGTKSMARARPNRARACKMQCPPGALVFVAGAHVQVVNLVVLRRDLGTASLHDLTGQVEQPIEPVLGGEILVVDGTPRIHVPHDLRVPHQQVLGE